MSSKIPVRDICFIGIFTAVIAVFAQLSIPMPYGVPITLQTLAIPLAGIVLGAKKGALSTLVYVLLGAAGVPVLSNFTGGLTHVLGPSGGFILSFPLMALAAGLGAAKNSKLRLIFGLVAGAVVNYACGTAYFMLVMSSDAGTALAACILPFIPADILKFILAAVLGRSIKTALARSKILS